MRDCYKIWRWAAGFTRLSSHTTNDQYIKDNSFSVVLTTEPSTDMIKSYIEILYISFILMQTCTWVDFHWQKVIEKNKHTNKQTKKQTEQHKYAMK